MSMSTSVVGIKPPNEKWKRMKEIWDSCKAGDVSIPKEVCDFFDDEVPDEKGVVVDLDECKSPYKDDMEEGFEIDVSKLPKDVTIIRFVNSY